MSTIKTMEITFVGPDAERHETELKQMVKTYNRKDVDRVSLTDIGNHSFGVASDDAIVTGLIFRKYYSLSQYVEFDRQGKEQRNVLFSFA